MKTSIISTIIVSFALVACSSAQQNESETYQICSQMKSDLCCNQSECLNELNDNLDCSNVYQSAKDQLVSCDNDATSVSCNGWKTGNTVVESLPVSCKLFFVFPSPQLDAGLTDANSGSNDAGNNLKDFNTQPSYSLLWASLWAQFLSGK